jgi:DNA polymerase-1
MHGIPDGQPVPKELRQGAKAINFGTIYGAGGAGLAESAWASYGVVMTPAQAGDARDRFLKRYSGVAHWMQGNADACQRRGFITIGNYGRVIMAEWEAVATTAQRASLWHAYDEDEDDDDDDDGAGWSSQWALTSASRPVSPLKHTLCCNAPVQGACADILLAGITRVDRALTEAGISDGLILAVHDELVLEVTEDRAEEAAGLLREVMEQAFAEYFPHAPVNRLVEVHIVERWGDAKA